MKRVRCYFGLHKLEKEEMQKVRHKGEFPWERWVHVCFAKTRSCKYCQFTKVKPCQKVDYQLPNETGNPFQKRTVTD